MTFIDFNFNLVIIIILISKNLVQDVKTMKDLLTKSIIIFEIIDC